MKKYYAEEIICNEETLEIYNSWGDEIVEDEDVARQRIKDLIDQRVERNGINQLLLNQVDEKGETEAIDIWSFVNGKWRNQSDFEIDENEIKLEKLIELSNMQAVCKAANVDYSRFRNYKCGRVKLTENEIERIIEVFEDILN